MNRKILKLNSLILLGWLGLTVPALAKPPYPVLGYLPDYASGINVNNLDWNDMTHVIEAFAEPTATGGVVFQAPGQRAGLITTAHANGTRCMLTFGGQGGASSATWDSAIGATYLSTFITNIMSTMTTNGYDGVDIDWEFPTNGEKAAFMNFMNQLGSALHATNGYDTKPRQLTFFISPGSAICGVDWTTIGNYADYGILSGYAYGLDQFNGPLNDTAPYGDCFGNSRQGNLMDSVAMLATKGFPKSQLILGMPLESSTGNPDNTVLTGTQTAYYATQAEASYSTGDTGVNNSQSFCDKMNWAFSQSPALPGIAMWEISEAYPPTNSAVTALWAVIGNRSGCVTVLPPTTPTDTFTVTPTPTLTFTRTPTNSYTPTPTWTLSFTPTSTFTPTSSYTFTNTLTFTPSPTPTFTLPAGTNTPTPANTATFTATYTVTFTFSATFTYTNSPTLTPTFTVTLSPTPTFTPVLTNSPTAVVVADPVLYPNPAKDGAINLLIPPQKPGDTVTIHIYTIAFRKVNDLTVTPALNWIIPLPVQDQWGTPLANGLYYVFIQTSQGKWTKKLLVLR